MKKGYIPTQQLKRLEWMEALLKQLKVDGINLGISQQKIEEFEKLVKKLREEVDAGIEMENARKSQTDKTKVADKNASTEARDIAQKVKTNDNYDDAVGKRYGIIGEENSVDVANSKPQVKAKKVPTGWELSFNLLGFFDGMKIFRKRPTDANFIFLAVDTSSPYIDTDAMVSGTQYYAFFMLGDEQVGLQSDTVTVQV